MNKLMQSIAAPLLVCALGAGAGLLATRGIQALSPDHVEGDYSQQRMQTHESVIVLGTDWCDYCRKTREFLRSRGVGFADLDIEKSGLARQWHDELGDPSVPVVLIGDRQIRGFDPDAMTAAIAAIGPELRVDRPR